MDIYISPKLLNKKELQKTHSDGRDFESLLQLFNHYLKIVFKLNITKTQIKFRFTIIFFPSNFEVCALLVTNLKTVEKTIVESFKTF